MNVLFLDIDGVLNSADWYRRRPSPNLQIDPDAVAVLRGVLEQTDARVVISSTWRILHSLPRIQKILAANGLGDFYAMNIVGATPVIPEQSVLGPRMCRGLEIAHWMRMVPVDTFAIVDDDNDMGNLASRLVQTTWEHGLQAEHAERLVELLTSEAIRKERVE